MSSNRHPRRLLAYLDGELGPEERSTIESHLRVCEACRREAAGHRQLDALLVTALPTPVPGGLWAELQPRLSRRRQPENVRLAWATYLVVALLGLGAGGWAGWSMSEDLGEEDSPDLLAETSLYDIPEESYTRDYLYDLSSADDEEAPR